MNNNSTDLSISIAQKYSFVTVLHEGRQHQSFAQYTGFDNAKGEILARIDADTILPGDWVERVVESFTASPDTLAVTGSGKPYDFVLQRPAQFILDKYYIVAHHLAGHVMMWGSNCAFRGSAWPKIKNELTLSPNIWEDYDLAFCLARHGDIKMQKGIEVRISFRAVHKPPLHQLRYQFRSARTFATHKGILRAAIFGIAWSSLVLVGPIIIIDHYILLPIRKNRATFLKLFFGWGQKPRTGTINNSK